MNDQLREISKKRFKVDLNALPAEALRVVEYFGEREPISRDTNREFETKSTFGERLADQVAAFGGSWTFIILFGVILLAWVLLNSLFLAQHGGSFDPYPYILLNLFLSMLAAIQAPIILMSQKRQAAKDRLDAANDYEINLKAELEILSVHEKLDDLSQKKWVDLIVIQQEQIRLLTQLLKEHGVATGNGHAQESTHSF
ncbi:MAG TPA: DUF1003 domain-containing protein [Anaerolineae bacterium]|nr:DUF1003 domain-containing protein [Anaerolineae bacterium]